MSVEGVAAGKRLHLFCFSPQSTRSSTEFSLLCHPERSEGSVCIHVYVYRSFAMLRMTHKRKIKTPWNSGKRLRDYV